MPLQTENCDRCGKSAELSWSDKLECAICDRCDEEINRPPNTVNLEGYFPYFQRLPRQVSDSRSGPDFRQYPRGEVLRDLAAAIELRDQLARAIDEMERIVRESA